MIVLMLHFQAEVHSICFSWCHTAAVAIIVYYRVLCAKLGIPVKCCSLITVDLVIPH